MASELQNKVSVQNVEFIENETSSGHKEMSAASTFDNLSESEIKTLEKTLVRKVDSHLIVALFGLFIFNILDRSNIASARLGGLQKDLNLTDTQYQTSVSILFVGYLLGQLPSNILLTRIRPSYYLPVAILVWGGISLCTAATKNYVGILLVRLFLGFAESPFFAGALLLISSWYKPSEIAPRVALMYCGNTVANGFGGVLAAGVLSGLDGAHGIEGWRWLYIIEGAGTMFVGVIAYWLLPDFPNSGPITWLTDQEQRYAEHRLTVAINNEVDEVGGVKSGLKDAFSDIKVWTLVFIQVCILSSQTWTYFFPTIVKTLGYGKTQTLLLTAPVYVFGFFTSLGNAFLAQRTGKRAILIMWPLTLDIIGNIMVVSSHKTAIRFTGMFFMCAGSYSAFNVIQAWIGSTIPRTRTKRAISYAMVNMIGNLANVYGAYFFPSSSSPQFVRGGIALSSFAFCGILAAGTFGLYLRHLNKKTEKQENLDGVIRYKYIY